MYSIGTIIRQLVNSFFGRVVKTEIISCRLPNLTTLHAYNLTYKVSAEGKTFEVSIPVIDWNVYDSYIVEIK